MMHRTPSRIEAAADWMNKRADYRERHGFVVSAIEDRRKADHLFIQAYYLRKYGTVYPWA